MVEPLATLTAGAIAQLAFNEFVKSGAGELAKKATGEALVKVNDLRKLIWTKFKGDAKAEKALTAIEQEGSAAALTKLETYLDDAMAEDESGFATEIRQVAQQIINIQNQNAEGDRVYNQSAGRDIFNVEKIEGGSNKFGGS